MKKSWVSAAEVFGLFPELPMTKEIKRDHDSSRNEPKMQSEQGRGGLRWTTSTSGETIPCPGCGENLVGYTPSCDHHGVTCPNCNDALILISTSAKNHAVCISRCPHELQRFFSWCQSDLDELEFVSLLLSLEELLDGGRNSD